MSLPKQTEETATDGKRHRFLSRKALQNAISDKRKEVDRNARALEELYGAAKSDQKNLTSEKLAAIHTASLKYKQALDEIGELYQHDKWGDYEEEARITKEFSVLERARALTKDNDDNNDRASLLSKATRSVSRTSSSSSAARQRALAEAAAARKQAEYDRMIAEKETARRLKKHVKKETPKYSITPEAKHKVDDN